MGSSLRRQLREALPPSIKGLQRAIALEIADDARYDDDWNYDPENGRRSKVRLAELVRWTAAKDELSVREMLRRLSLAGWEFRLPIGKDKNGNLLYAVPGKAMTFRVPDFEGPTTVGPCVEVEVEGPTTVGPSEGEGPTVVGEGPTTVGPRANQGWAMAQPPLGVGPTTVGPPSPSISSSSLNTSPSSSLAEDSSAVTETVTTATEGGGGGDIDSSQDQDQNRQRAEVFVAGLDYRGKAPDKQQQQKLCALAADALAAGWSERGLDRYLDISDDPNVRNAASLYVYKLNPERLPDAGPAEAVAAGLPPLGPDCSHDPRAASSPVFRTTPLGEPCPDCHPDRVAQKATKLPPACEHCLDFNPGAEFNVRLRTDRLSFQGGPCPRCHPSMVPGDWVWPGMPAANGAATGARVASHTADDYANASAADLFVPRPGARLTGTDAKVAGWMAIANGLREERHANSGPRPMIAPPHQPYRNPTDQAVYNEDFPDAEIVDQSVYDTDL